MNASKTKTIIAFRSQTITPLSLDGIVPNEPAELVILGASFNAKMSVEKHLRSVSRAAAQMPGIPRKSWQVFHDRSLLLRSF